MRPVTQLAPSAPASQPPPGRSAPPDAAAGFAAVLDNQKARTAVAEGQTPKRPTGAQDQKATSSPATPDARDAAVDASQTSTTGDARKDVTEDAGAPTPALPVLVVPAPAALAVVPVPVTVTPPVVPAPPASTPPAPPLPTPAAPAAGLPTDAAPAPSGPAGSGTPLPGAPLPSPALVPGGPNSAAPAPTPDGAAPSAPATGDAPAGIAVPAGTDTQDAPPAPPADSAATSDADTRQQSQPGTDQRRDDAGAAAAQSTAPRTMSRGVADALRAAAPAASTADASATAAATATPPTATTATASTAAAPATPTSAGSVTLAQAVETVRLTVSAAAQRGVTRARIALRPEELGGVEVHLRHTAEGLSARIVAEVPEAAHLLSQAAGELRRTLEQQGVNIVRIDVGTAGDEATGPGAGAAGNEQRGGRRHGGSSAAGDTPETDLPIPERTIELPNGALVDVLA